MNIRIAANTFERPKTFWQRARELDREEAMTGHRAFRRTDLEPGAGQ